MPAAILRVADNAVNGGLTGRDAESLRSAYKACLEHLLTAIPISTVGIRSGITQATTGATLWLTPICPNFDVAGLEAATRVSLPLTNTFMEFPVSPD
jgi:hypothetical protein